MWLWKHTHAHKRSFSDIMILVGCKFAHTCIAGSVSGTDQSLSTTTTNHNNHMPQHTFPIPAKSAGLIIGKGGSRIKDISRTSGCRCSVKDDKVLISYSSTSQLNSAIAAIQKVLNQKRSLYAHPVVAFTVLPDDCTALELAKPPTKTNTLQCSEALFLIKPLLADETDELSQQFSRMSVSSKDTNFPLHKDAIAQVDKIYEEYENHLKELKSNEVLRFRFSIGYNCLLSRSTRAGEKLSHSDLARMKYGKDYRLRFSTNLHEDFVSKLEKWLENEGYEKTEKMEISAHLITAQGNHIDVKKESEDDGSSWTKPCECKSDKRKHALINWIANADLPHVRWRYDSSTVRDLTEEEKRYVADLEWKEDGEYFLDHHQKQSSLSLDSLRPKRIVTYKSRDSSFTFMMETVYQQNSVQREVVLKSEENEHPSKMIEKIVNMMKSI